MILDDKIEEIIFISGSKISIKYLNMNNYIEYDSEEDYDHALKKLQSQIDETSLANRE